jgi:hypothetical protein
MALYAEGIIEGARAGERWETQPRIVWACPLVVKQRIIRGILTDTTEPLIVQTARDNDISLAWFTTGSVLAKPYAVGVAAVDSAQEAAVDALGQCMYQPIRFLDTQFQDLNAAWRNKCNTILTGLDLAPATDTETVRQIMNRMLASFCANTVEDAEMRLAKKLGEI